MRSRLASTLPMLLGMLVALSCNAATRRARNARELGLAVRELEMPGRPGNAVKSASASRASELHVASDRLRNCPD